MITEINKLTNNIKKINIQNIENEYLDCLEMYDGEIIDYIFLAIHNYSFDELKYEQKIPSSLDRVWDYFSSPMNLKEITPAYMNFLVTSSAFREKMYPGMMITYKVSPLLGIRLDWCTEITQVNHLTYFVDEQREGPYTIWHHQHHFEEIEGGVLMTDIIHYKIPFGVLGNLANRLFIKRQLRSIFEFRIKKVNELFGQMK